ncbi:MAG TPA: translocation/assembly module TamB domain-containing protein, partial [Desulfuromonadales bacterium]
MVKRLLLITLIVLLLLTAGLVTGGWWLLKDENGVRWLLGEISRRSAVTVEARQIEGRLRDRVRLEGVSINWPQGEARFDGFELRWHPASLLRGHLEVDALALAGGEIAWEASPTGKKEGAEVAAFAWPRLAGWPLRLWASIAVLQIERIELQPPEGKIQRLERLSARLDWRKGTFSIADLDAAVAGYRLQGLAAAGLGRPLLRLDLQLGLPAAAAGMDGLSLQADLVPESDVGFVGPLTLQGRSGAETHLQLATDLALRGDTLHLRRFELSQPGRRGTLSGEGEVRLPGGAPKWRLRATVADLDLGPVTGGVTTDLAGTVEGTGEGTDYRGSFDLANRAADWRSARLAGPFAGDADGMSFPQLAGSWLRGDLAGNIRLAWREGFTLAGSLRGRRLDPAAFTPEWPGRVNLDLAGDLAIPASGPPIARLNGRLLDSTLRGRALTGKVEAELAGEDLRLAALELHGDGFDLSGGGRLAERLDFRVEIVRLSGLLPTAQGVLSAQGWLRWRNGTLAGEIDAHGRQIAYDDLRIEALQLAAHLPGDSPSVTGNLSASGILYGRWQLLSVGLNLAGSVQKHLLDLQARWPGGELQAAAGGGWQDGRWTGTLQQLAGQDEGAGPWRLAEPAGVEAAADRLRISSLQLAGRDSERLRLDGSLVWGAGMGEGEAQWEEIDLSRFNPWLAEIVLDGSSSGETRVRWQKNRPVELSGRLSAAGGITHGEQTVNVRHLAGEFAWAGTGLQAELAATLEDGGGIDARVATSEPLRASFPRQGEALVLWQDLDLGLFSPWLKPTVLTGRSSGDSRLRWLPDGSLVLAGKADAAGTLFHDAMKLTMRQIETKFDWNADGLQATLLVALEEGGRFNSRVQSDQPGRLALPDRGHIEADWAELNLVRLRPWLPEGFELEGRLGGSAAGDWLPGGHLALTGEAAVEKGRLSWRTEDGEVAADLRTARLDWDWRGETLAGELELALAEYGEVKGTFRLPLPARLPVALKPSGSLQLALEAKAREKGLLSAVFPGLVHKSRGELELHAQVGGTWQDPDLTGTVQLSGAGAYFPAAGIELHEVALACELAGDELRIASFHARSGPGQVNGSGSVRLQRWRPAAYRGTLKGERFEAVHLPELELLVTPDLTIEGSAERLQVRGEIRIPELT